MKRLIKKADEVIDRIREEVLMEEMNPNDTNMTQLNELDEADMRHDICPKCKYSPIKRKDGFKVCPKCTTVYKMLDGDGFIVEE